jgi:hypothetical protein
MRRLVIYLAGIAITVACSLSACGSGAQTPSSTSSVAAPVHSQSTVASEPQRTSGDPSQPRRRRNRIPAAARSELTRARACLLRDGFRAASNSRSYGVTHVAGGRGADAAFHIQEVTLSTHTGIYSIGIAPSPYAARAWLRALSSMGSQTNYGGIASGAAAFAATPYPGKLLNGDTAYFAERRTVVSCAFGMPEMSGSREVIGYWRHSP